MAAPSSTARLSPAVGRPPQRRKTTLARRRSRTAYYFLLPPILFFALMFFYPLGSEFVTSFYTGTAADQFSGLSNYHDTFTDDQARHAFLVTIRYALGVLVIGITLGLLLALILNQRMRGRTVFRGILLIPYLTSIAIVGLLWRNILDPQLGVLNRVLGSIGLPQQDWLNQHALATIIGIAVWQEVGYITLLFLAGLQGIPEMYYEAARIDGAAPWQRFRHITLPLLAPTTLFVCIIGVISSLQQFALPYVVTNGGPGDATDLFVYRVYREAFEFRNFGYSSALSYLMLIVILVLSMIQLRVGRNRAA